jgi:hypothetical protein
VHTIRPSALVDRNPDKHRIRVVHFLHRRAGVLLISRVGIVWLVAWLRFIRASVWKCGRWVHSIDGTYFAKRGLVTAWFTGKGPKTVYRAFPNLAARRHRQGPRLNLHGRHCRRRHGCRCRYRGRVRFRGRGRREDIDGARLGGCLLNRWQFGGRIPVGRTHGNRGCNCHNHQSAHDPRQEMVRLVHCQIML